MFADYVPIIIMLVIATGFAAVALTLAWLLAPSRPDASKLSTYECGVEPVGDARERFSVRFYVVAMLFIVFDLETVFMFPWAVVFKKLPMFYFIQMFIFLIVLTVGLVYEWRMGALDWNQTRGKLLWRSRHDEAA